MDTVKPATFRLNEEDIEKFKVFAKENNLKQEDAFASLLNTLELNNAKSALGTRANSIEVFQRTANNLINFYINSLQENVVTEERIRGELSKELKTKEDTINTILEELRKLKLDKSENELVFSQQSSELEKTKEQILDWIDKNNKLKKDTEDKQKSIDVLTRNNLNQMQQLEEYKDLKSANDLLLKRLEEYKSINVSLENTKAQLEDKIKNSVDMLSFYRDNISELKDNVEQYKSDIKELKLKNDNQIIEIKDGYQKSLEKEKGNSEQYKLDIAKLDEKYQNQIKELRIDYENSSKKEIEFITEQLKNKYSVEASKKDFEINKLENEIETLKVKKKL